MFFFTVCGFDDIIVEAENCQTSAAVTRQRHMRGLFGKRYVIDHFTVECLVAWPLNESEAGGDVVLIESSLLFLC